MNQFTFQGPGRHIKYFSMTQNQISLYRSVTTYHQMPIYGKLHLSEGTLGGHVDSCSHLQSQKKVHVPIESRLKNNIVVTNFALSMNEI